MYPISVFDLPSKKAPLQKIFGSNLHLKDREVREMPQEHWAALRAARAKFAVSDASFIRATLYDQVRTYFERSAL